MNKSAYRVGMILYNIHHCFMKNKSLQSYADIGESLLVNTTALLGPRSTNIPPAHTATLSSFSSKYGNIISPWSLLNLFLWQNEGDGIFLCGSYTLRSTPKIELFGPTWGITFNEKTSFRYIY